MKTWHAAIAAGFLMAGAASAGVDAALPAWKDREQPGTETAGSPLDKDDPGMAVEPLDIAPPSAEEIAATAQAGEYLPEKYWAAYFADRPREFLIDPQQLLGRTEFRSRLAFLNEHAADSRIDLFVYLFKGDQEIPGEVRAEELIERFFSSGRPAALVFYYLGAPQRSVLYLSPSMTDVVSANEQHRALESSIMQAIAKKDPSTQIEEFLVQMSIRIYWMERMVGGGITARGGTPDYLRKGKAQGKKSALLEKLQPVLENARRLMVPTAVLSGAVLAGWLMILWWGRRTCYRLPVWHVEPRLGADHAAGIGAVISFASATVSPASQRDQMPDDWLPR
jgi:hypothetical protein